MTPRGTLPTSSYANPHYKAKEKKNQEEAQQPEEKKLNTIVSEQKKRKEVVPRKYKSTTPRASRATTERKTQNVTLIPARPEKIEGGLTKIGRPSFLPQMPGTMSPRGQFESGKPPTIRSKNTAPGTIDEGKESSAEVSKIESLEEQHTQATKSPHFTVDELQSRIPNKKLPRLPIAARKPSGFKRAKPASATRPDLGVILPPRERKNLPEPAHSWKAPSDDADFQERGREFPKMPLLRTDRILNLGSRVVREAEATGPSTQPEAQQLDSNIGEQELLDVDAAVATLTSLPQIPGEPEQATEANLDEKLFDFDAIETLLNPDADDAKIQTILSGAREEHETSSESTSQKDIEPDHGRQKNLEEISNELDALKKFVILKDRSDKKQPVRTMPSFMSQNLAPATSEKMVKEVKRLIENSDGDRSKSYRALNIILCAAGGTLHERAPMTWSPVMYPETDACAQKLIETPDINRYEYIDTLLDELRPYLTETQYQMVRSSLPYVYSAIYAEKEPKLIEFALDSLRGKLEAELRAIN